MSGLKYLWAMLVVAAKRLLSQPGISLATMLGYTTAIALTISIPFYADSVYSRLFRENVLAGDQSSASASHQPPLAFLFTYEGSLYGPKPLEAIEPVDQYLSEQAGVSLGLPQRLSVRYLTTDTFQMFPGAQLNYPSLEKPLGWFSFASLSDVQQHISLLEGALPSASPNPDDSIGVLISKKMAQKMGLQVGEDYTAFSQYEDKSKKQTTLRIKFYIAGVWQPNQPDEAYWFSGPRALDERLLVTEDTFRQQIGPQLPDEVYLAAWYLVLEDSAIHYREITPLIYKIMQVQRRSESLISGMYLSRSPLGSLKTYQRNAAALTLQLYAFSVPILVLLFAFIGLTAMLSVDQRRNEIAVLRSRGVWVSQITGITLIEGLILGSLSFGFSLPISLGVTWLIGHTQRFLDFSAPTDLPLTLTMPGIYFGLAAFCLALICQLLPTMNATRNSIVTYMQERARALRRPWWQRAWLDVLLLIPVVYTFYILHQPGNLAVLSSLDPFENPLFFLVPALSIFSLALFCLRLIPILMGAIAALASKTRRLGVLMAANHLSRSPGLFITPLMLLMLTLSLSAFFASLARTIDDHMRDMAYYLVGSELRFLDTGESVLFRSQGLIAAGQASETQPDQPSGPRWLFLPVSEFLTIPGVQDAVQVASYPAQVDWGGAMLDGNYLGVDRYGFARVAFWRRDFASANLGSLMNALALAPEGVLLPRTLMAQYSLNFGDTVHVRVKAFDVETSLEMKVVGAFDLFPTWYPDQGPLFVGNLEYLFARAGVQFPYQVWLKTDPQLDVSQIQHQAVNALGIQGINWQAVQPKLIVEEQRPERQGLFGVLSVGFVAATFFSVLGFVLYAFYSFKQRFIEFGILRAIGLSSWEMTWLLAWELGFLILFGTAVGTGLGVSVSRLFIPYLQFGTSPQDLIPPYIVTISWASIFQIYGILVLLFLSALAVLVGLLRQMKVFQAIKMGETTWW